MSRRERVGYQDIAAELRARIGSDVYPAGGQLPTEAALMAEFGVARGTASHAYKVLEAEGLVRTVDGRGRFVAVPGATDGDYVGRAPYLAVADALRKEIEDGRPAAGEALPSAAELAKTLSVSVATARRAVHQLRDWGLVEARQGVRARVRARS